MFFNSNVNQSNGTGSLLSDTDDEMLDLSLAETARFSSTYNDKKIQGNDLNFKNKSKKKYC